MLATPAIAGRYAWLNRQFFFAHLSGREAAPESVNTQAEGLAVFLLSIDGTKLYYTILVANIEEAKAANIHLAPLGESAPVVVKLFSGSFSGTGVLAIGIITEDDLVGPLEELPLSTLIGEVENGNAYVNIQTILYPAGEIWGQVRSVNLRERWTLNLPRF